MATKTAVGIKITKKPKRERVTLSSEERMTGPEPEWTGVEEGEVYDKKLRQAMFYCNHHYSLKDMKRDVLRYIEKLQIFTKEEMRKLGGAYDSKTSVSISTASSLCRAGSRGAPLRDEHKKFIATSFTDLINKWKEIKEPVADPTTPAVYKPTIQDRLNEKTSEIIGEIEGHYDDFITQAKTNFKPYDFLVANNVVQSQLGKYEQLFAKRKQELELAQSKKDDQLKEAYSHYKSADFKRVLKWIDELLEAVEQYRDVKKATKKARIKKAPSKEKLVGKLKYMIEEKTLKMVSINPGDIIGASELWVYNAKTRKLGKYVSAPYKQLSVKGTSIEGFDTDKSVCKTLRKPADQLKEFGKAGKIQLRKFLDDIKATETKLNGRISTDVLLLKVA